MGEALAGKVAWVGGVGDGTSERAREIGRAVALLFAAKGARVLVTGADEKTIGRCVGEIAHGGGQARHFVAKLETSEEARGAVAAARERFGALHVAVLCVSGALDGAARAFDAARDEIGSGGKLVLIVTSPAGDPRVAPFVLEVAKVFSPRGIACNAILLGDIPAPIRSAEAEDIAELAATLAGAPGDVITGATLLIC